jgi:hypothetical protein
VREGRCTPPGPSEARAGPASACESRAVPVETGDRSESHTEVDQSPQLKLTVRIHVPPETEGSDLVAVVGLRRQVDGCSFDPRRYRGAREMALSHRSNSESPAESTGLTPRSSPTRRGAGSTRGRFRLDLPPIPVVRERRRRREDRGDEGETSPVTGRYRSACRRADLTDGGLTRRPTIYADSPGCCRWNPSVSGGTVRVDRGDRVAGPYHPFVGRFSTRRLRSRRAAVPGDPRELQVEVHRFSTIGRRTAEHPHPFVSGGTTRTGGWEVTEWI